MSYLDAVPPYGPGTAGRIVCYAYGPPDARRTGEVWAHAGEDAYAAALSDARLHHRQGEIAVTFDAATRPARPFHHDGEPEHCAEDCDGPHYEDAAPETCERCGGNDQACFYGCVEARNRRWEPGEGGLTGAQELYDPEDYHNHPARYWGSR